jgi:putative holliday junction resolvase
MKILGLDLGTRTLGIAISDHMEILASPVETYRFKDGDYESAIVYLEKYIKQYGLNKIIIGLPLHMTGEVGESAKLIINFKELLEKRYKIEVVTIDERWSTKSAQRTLIEADISRAKRKNLIDKMAAVVILQSYLDRQKKG